RRRGVLPRHRATATRGSLAPLWGADARAGVAGPRRSMVSDADYRAVVEFLYREARLADEARYAEWEALWAEDGVYWVPATTDPRADPDRQISHIYDNRQRIATRVKLLPPHHHLSHH